MTFRNLSAVCAIGICGLVGSAVAETESASVAPLAKQRSALVREIRQTVGEYPDLGRSAHFKAALNAVAKIPREEFVPADQRGRAYQDTPLPIGFDETISAPYTVTVMTAAANVGPGAKVLEVGTGSGYQAAVLSRIGARVYSIEIVDQLTRSAAARLARLRIGNVTIRSGDGFAGWPEVAPFDAIIVTAGAAQVPETLQAQLKVGGKLVMPIGPTWAQEQLLVITKTAEKSTQRCSLGSTSFVPLTGVGARPARSMGLYDRSIPACFAGQRALF